MASSPLPNYLRAHRKRLALSQEELAFLLGAQCGAKVSRYEKFAREPGLNTVFACEVVFGKSASELFAGMYQRIEREVATRAKALVERADQKSTPLSTEKRQALLNLAALAVKQTT